MKSVIVTIKPEPAVREIKYPCLFRSWQTGTIVLFASEREGTCLNAGKYNTFGQYSKHWAPCTDTSTWEMLPPDQVVQLSND